MEQESASLFLGPGEPPEQIEKLLDSITDLVQSVRLDGSLAYVNRAWRETLGYSAAAIERLKVFDIIHPTSLEHCREVFARVAAGEAVGPFETTFVTAAGKPVQLEGKAAVSFEGGRPVLIRAVLRDVSERKLIERRLRASDERFRKLVEESSDAIILADSEGLITYASPSLQRVTGFSADERLGRSGFERLHPDDLGAAREYFGRVLARPREHLTFRCRARHKDGGWRTLDVICTNHLSDTAVEAIVVNFRDVTKALQFEKALREGESRKAAMLDAALDCVITIDHQGAVLEFNPAAELAFGYGRAEVIGRTMSELIIPPAQREQHRRGLQHYMETGEGPLIGRRIEVRAMRRDGTEFPVELALTRLPGEGPPVFTAFLRDLTAQKEADEQRRQTEEQMRHAQKLESLGVLAGGIAHDFNNLLTVVLGNAELVRRYIPPDSQATPMLASLETAARRAADLTREMLAYAGRAPIVRETCDLSTLVREMSQLLAAAVSKSTPFDLHLASTPALVDGDPTQIRQVVMNLITNASEAYGDRSGPIPIRTSVINTTADVMQSPYITPAPPPGSYVCLEVIDDGCGMPPEILTRMFEPFFTTKFIGRGLGLAATLGIVRGHRGTIQVTSNPGAGTTVRVLFPQVAGRALDSLAPPAEEKWKGSGRLLVVDDEDPVRRVATEMLTGAGFEVLTAGDGGAAIDVLRMETRDVRAVLLDLTTDAPGIEALEAIQRARPGVPVMVMSGYTLEDLSRRFPGQRWAGFVQKPFALSDLLRAVRGVLEPAR